MLPLPSYENWPDPGERFKHIELEICTRCDLDCFGCDRLSDIKATWMPAMTVEQVSRFVDESLALDWEWERIRLLGSGNVFDYSAVSLPYIHNSESSSSSCTVIVLIGHLCSCRS